MVVDGMHFHHGGCWVCVPHFSSCQNAGASAPCAVWGRVSSPRGLCPGFCSCRRHDPGEQASLLLSQLQLLSRSCFAEGFLARKQVPWKCDTAVFLPWCVSSLWGEEVNLPSRTVPPHHPVADIQRHRPQHGAKLPELPGCWFPQLHEGEISTGANLVFTMSCPHGSHSFLAWRQSRRLSACVNANLEKQYWNTWKIWNICTVKLCGVPAESNSHGYRDTNAKHSCHSGAGAEKHVKTDGDVVDCKFFAF